MSFGAAPPGMDEYQRLMAERTAAAKRKRNLSCFWSPCWVGGGVLVFQKNAAKRTQAQAILDAAGRFAERDKTEMGAFWNCVMSSEVDVGSSLAPTRLSSGSRAPTSPSRRPTRIASR